MLFWISLEFVYVLYEDTYTMMMMMTWCSFIHMYEFCPWEHQEDFFSSLISILSSFFSISLSIDLLIVCIRPQSSRSWLLLSVKKSKAAGLLFSSWKRFTFHLKGFFSPKELPSILALSGSSYSFFSLGNRAQPPPSSPTAAVAPWPGPGRDQAGEEAQACGPTQLQT